MQPRLEMRLEQKTRTYPIFIIGYEKMMHAKRRLRELGFKLDVTKALVNTPLRRGTRYTLNVQISEALNTAIQSVEDSLPDDPVDESERLDLLIEIAKNMPLEQRR